MKSGTGLRPCRILSPPVKRPFAESNQGPGATEGDERQRGRFLRHSGGNAGPAAPLARFNIDSGGVGRPVGDSTGILNAAKDLSAGAGWGSILTASFLFARIS